VRSKRLEPRTDDDAADVDLFGRRFLLEIDGLALSAGLNTGFLTLVRLELNARFGIDQNLLGYGLGNGK